MRRAYTLTEISVAILVLGVMIAGGASSLKFFARPAGQYDVTNDQLSGFQVMSERVDREMREARSVIYPAPGKPPAQMIVVRTFEGRQRVYYFSATTQQLRRVLLDASGGSPTGDESVCALDTKLERAYFQVSTTGLVSWGLFASQMFVLGSCARENR